MKKRMIASLMCAAMIMSVPMSSLAATKPSPEASVNGLFTWYVQENDVNIRRGPGTNYESLGHVHKNDEFFSFTADGDWRNGTMKTGQNSGVSGYIRKDFLKHTKAN